MALNLRMRERRRRKKNEWPPTPNQIKSASDPCVAPSFRECQDLSNITSKGEVWWSNGLAYTTRMAQGLSPN